MAMRIRQVRPEFWSDKVIAGLPMPGRLFYIGLWNVADDAGWLRWDVEQIGAVLFPYDGARHREKAIRGWGDQLVKAGRLLIEDCGCACIPTLPKHQRINGVQSFTVRDQHLAKHLPLMAKQSPLSHSPVTVSNVEVGNVEVTARARTFTEAMTEHGAPPPVKH
jgi:hypothetical protein